MPIYEQIQPLSFHIIPESPELTVSYDRIALPDVYKQELLNEYERLKPKAKSLPIDDLNRLVRLLVPDLYNIDNYAGKPKNNWLRAEADSVDIEGIRIILDEWSNAHGMGNVPLPSPTNFQWEKTSTCLSDWGQNPNGTAKAADSATYDILPALLAQEIENQPFDFGGANNLTFYRVSKSPGGKGHEMMTWPPLPFINKKDGSSWYYSYYLRIAIATIPFVSVPVVNVYLGIRRWVSAYHQYMPNEQLSVYLRAGVSYIRGVKGSHTFQVAPAKVKPPDYGLVWGDKLPSILEHIGFPDQIPDPEMLRRNPIPTLQSATMPNIGLVYNTRMGSPDHEVNPGVAPYDRAKLLEILSAKWNKWLKVVPSLSVSQVRSSSNDRSFNISADDSKKAITQRWARLRQQHSGSTIRIEIYHQRPESRNAMLDALGKLLDITPQPGEYERDYVKLKIEVYKLGDLGAGLERSRDDTLRSVMEGRKNQVLTTIGRSKGTTIALIELGNDKQFKNFEYKKGNKNIRKSTDPKQSLRAAFAHTGRLSQFFTILTDIEKDKYLKGPEPTDATNDPQKPRRSHIPERFTNAALDGLRQLGVHEGGKRVASGRWKLNSWDYSVAGFWLVRKSRKSSQSNQQQLLPTLVYIDGKTGQVLAWVAGMQEMLPYHEVLLRAGRGEIEVHETQDEVARRLPQDLDDRLSGEDVVLAVDVSQAGMRYKVWNWLQDSKIETDKVVFNDNRNWLPHEKSGLRIVRIRSAEEEVPTWYAVPEDTSEGLIPGIGKGVWRVSDRVFASTVGTPRTQQFNRNITKTDTDKADRNTPNPGFYELTAAFLQKGDDPAEIVSMVHQLRAASAQSADDTADALPLHLAQRIEEYLLWVEEQETSEAEENSED